VLLASCHLDALLRSGDADGGQARGRRLVFTVQPSNVVVNQYIAPAVEVTALDDSGNVDTAFAGTVTIRLGANPGGAILSGSTSGDAARGVVAFPSLILDVEGPGYRLTASAAGIAAASSEPFDVLPASSVVIAMVEGDAQTDTVGATLATPYRVRVTDGSGNGVPGVSVAWAVTGGGTITPSSATTDGGGYASATRVLGTTAGTQRATASAGGLPGSPVTFTATAVPGAPSQLTFTQQPTDTRAGEIISPAVRITLRDQFGNPATNASGSVTMSIAPLTGTPGAVLSGTRSRVPAAGVATFDDLSINLAGVGYRLRVATQSGNQDSDPFDVTPVGGSGSTMSAAGGDDQTDTVSATLAQPYRVRVTDASGNGVSGVPVTWAVTGGGGTIAPASTLTDGSGYAAATRVLGTTAGTQQAAASVAGLAGSPVTFTATAVHGTPDELVFTQQPSDAGAGQVIAPPVKVTIRDGFGNAATGFTGMISVSITPLTGTPLAVLSGTTSRTPSSGVASFDDLRIDLPGLQYRLRASAAGRTRDSAAFDVTL
jgi:adhesin/invasin